MNKSTTILLTLLCVTPISFAETHIVEAHSMTFEPAVVTVIPAMLFAGNMSRGIHMMLLPE